MGVLEDLEARVSTLETAMRATVEAFQEFLLQTGQGLEAQELVESLKEHGYQVDCSLRPDKESYKVVITAPADRQTGPRTIVYAVEGNKMDHLIRGLKQFIEEERTKW